MATVSATPSFTNAVKILHDATEADRGGELKRAYDLYMTAFEEFNKQLQPYYESAAAIEKKLNLESTTEFSGGKLDDVGGLGVCKEVLKEATIWPKKWNFANTFTRVLSIHSISPSDIVSKWMGDSEKQVKNIFQVARENAPSIVFIDEIDSLCGQRGEINENEASRRIKSELLIHMQEVCDGVKNVLILAATNTPFALDQAIRRRFDKRIYVRLPRKEARKHIFKVWIGKTRNTISEEEFEDLANDTRGFSGSDIFYFVKDALYEVVRATLTTNLFERSGEKWVPCQGNEEGSASLRKIDERGENSKTPTSTLNFDFHSSLGIDDLQIKVPRCTAAHFKKVRENQKATVTKDDLEKFDDFTKEFGIYGLFSIYFNVILIIIVIIFATICIIITTFVITAMS
ncbi:protein suppressor of k(+) transport growth defect 1 [Quercus suber]|uniref:Protein suppressor of k(+) transport growth defect 1 n=1 Tax=Quercus suber TaxID=58331 RepID=A0AAW0J0K7_QUESU